MKEILPDSLHMYKYRDQSKLPKSKFCKLCFPARWPFHREYDF